MCKKKWIYNLKNILFQNGFGYVWESPLNLNEKYFISEFKERLLDNFIQKWAADLSASRVLIINKSCKENFGYENYFNLLPRSLRNVMTKIRICTHSLRIQTGRYARNFISREERYCVCCNSGDIEDEFHFIFVCSAFEDIRKKYIARYYRENPSMFKLMQMLKESSNKTLQNLAIYCKKAFEARIDLINIVN